MKEFVKDFVRRGLLAAVGGPMILALVYLCLGASGTVQSVEIPRLAREIVSASLMAFIAGGISGIYAVEMLPFATASLIHLAVMYLDYIIFYLMNGWIQKSFSGIAIFSAIFIAGFFVVWLLIYFGIKRQIKKMNEQIS